MVETNRHILASWRSAVEANLEKDATLYEGEEKQRRFSRGIDFYLESLPKYTHGPFKTSFLDVIKRSGRKHKPVQVLDIGCAKGQALSDIKDMFGDKVETWGISATDFRTQESPKIDHYIVGDAQKINLDAGTFQVITAYQSFRYFADPLLVLKKAYSWLEARGYGFIDSVGWQGLPVYFEGSHIPFSLLLRAIREQGYDVQRDMGNKSRITDLVFRKTGNKPRMHLPIGYRGDYDQKEPDIKRMNYEWKGNMPKEMEREEGTTTSGVD